MPAAARPRGDGGAAVVEFVLVSLLVVLLFLLVFQVGVTLHTRNVLTSVAADGARFGANADVDPGDADLRARVRDGITAAFSAGYADEATVSASERDGVVEVRITAPVPMVLGAVSPITLEVAGHAYEEGR